MFSDGSTLREGDMAERGFKVILRFANNVSVLSCRYYFVQP